MLLSSFLHVVLQLTCTLFLRWNPEMIWSQRCLHFMLPLRIILCQLNRIKKHPPPLPPPHWSLASPERSVCAIFDSLPLSLILSLSLSLSLSFSLSLSEIIYSRFHPAPRRMQLRKAIHKQSLKVNRRANYLQPLTPHPQVNQTHARCPDVNPQSRVKPEAHDEHMIISFC